MNGWKTHVEVVVGVNDDAGFIVWFLGAETTHVVVVVGAVDDVDAVVGQYDITCITWSQRGSGRQKQTLNILIFHLFLIYLNQNL